MENTDYIVVGLCRLRGKVLEKCPYESSQFSVSRNRKSISVWESNTKATLIRNVMCLLACHGRADSLLPEKLKSTHLCI